VASACDNRGKPSFEDRSLSEVGSSTSNFQTVSLSTQRPSKLSVEERDNQLLLLKPPGSVIPDEDGPWRGGGTRGKQKTGLVNPKDCKYFTEWLGF